MSAKKILPDVIYIKEIDGNRCKNIYVSCMERDEHSQTQEIYFEIKEVFLLRILKCIAPKCSKGMELCRLL